MKKLSTNLIFFLMNLKGLIIGKIQFLGPSQLSF